VTAGAELAARTPTGSERTREVSRPEGADERSADLVAARPGPVTSDLAPATGHRDRLATVPAVDSVLAAPGQPLDRATRRLMQSRLRHDLGTVRIHTGPTADAAARSLGAVAFTQGPRVVLGSSAPPPSTTAGLRLLAHELTHTVQSRAEGPESPLRRAVKTPEAIEPSLAPGPGAAVLVLPPDQTERIIHRLEELVLTSDDPSQDQEGARRVAEYLVVTEELDRSHVVALFGELQARHPGLMRQVAFGGHVFHELRTLGVVDLAASVLWYLGETVVDTLAGDFVEDPTALAIVLRTLLSLIPGVDQAADVEDLLGNLFHGVMDPKNLLTIGWWFAVVLTLIGLFPAFGTAIKGTVKLTLKGIGSVVGTALDLVGPAFRGLVVGGWLPIGRAREAVAELLAKASTWGPWVMASFGEFLDTAITHLSALTSRAGGALASLLETLRELKKLATEWIPRAIEEVKRVLFRTRDELADAAGEKTRRLDDAADETGGVTRSLDEAGQASDEVTRPLDELGDAADEVTESSAEIAARVARLTPDEAAAQTRTVLEALKGGAGLITGGKWREALAELSRRGVGVDVVTRMTDVVMDAFTRPEAFAQAVRQIQEEVLGLADSEIVAEARRLLARGVTSSLDENVAAYVAAVKKQAERGGRAIVELYEAGPGQVLLVRIRNGIEQESKLVATDTQSFIPDDVFMTEVIRGGDAILDFAALKLQSGGPHGAITHVLHDLVADGALRAAGFPDGALGFRAMLGTFQDISSKFGVTVKFGAEGAEAGLDKSYSAGTAIWLASYDAVGGIAQPEVLWGRGIRDGVLKIAPGSL